MADTRKFISFFLEIIVWVAIWGLVTILGSYITHSREETLAFYLIVAVIGSAILFTFFADDL